MFVDTNVLFKASVVEAPDHEVARSRLDYAIEDGDTIRISRQILREYLAVLTRPQTWRVAVSSKS